jgi:hypothetical protein
MGISASRCKLEELSSEGRDEVHGTATLDAVGVKFESCRATVAVYTAGARSKSWSTKSIPQAVRDQGNGHGQYEVILHIHRYDGTHCVFGGGGVFLAYHRPERAAKQWV